MSRLLHYFKYSGKELETREGINQYDFHARSYNPAILLFDQPDKLADSSPGITPYLYCAANPLLYVDPTGKDWYRVTSTETGEILYKYTSLSSQDELDKAGIKVEYMGAIVVVMNGSRNEKLEKNNKLDGEGAITAKVTVYGMNGPHDIGEYIGFSMTANFEKFGAIDDGTYDANYDKKGMGSPYNSHYAVNGRNPVDCLDGINPSPPEYNPYSDTQKNGIFIHRTKSLSHNKC